MDKGPGLGHKVTPTHPSYGDTKNTVVKGVCVIFISLSLSLCILVSSLPWFITFREVTVGLFLPVSLQHDGHTPPHLNTMKPQLHLIIDMFR